MIRISPIKLSSLYRIEKTTGKIDEWVPAPNAPKMKGFCSGAAWRNTAEQDHYALNWLVAVGESELGQYIVSEEYSGSIHDIGKQLINSKDRLNIGYLFVEDSSDDNVAALCSMEGLTFYGRHTTIHGEDRWVSPDNRFAYFRSRDTIVNIGSVSPEISGDLASGFEFLHHLRKTKRLAWRTDCAMTDWVFRQKAPFDNVLKHPLTKAVIYCIMSMVKMGTPTTNHAVSGSSYGNRRR